MTKDNLTNETKSSNSGIEKIDTFLNDLYELRHSSIKKDKEKGIGNQVYKEFRNRGYIKNLKTLRTQLRDKELSVESVNENTSHNVRVKQSLKEYFTEKPTSSYYQDIIARPRYYELKEGITFEIKEITPRKFLEGVNTSKLHKDKSIIKLTENLTENKQERFPLPVIDTTTNRKYGADYVYALSEKYGKNTKCPVMIVKSIKETLGDGPAEWPQPYYDTSKADELSDEELANKVQWEVINTINCNHINGSKWIDCCMRDENQLINISDYLWVGVYADETGKIRNDNDGDSETYDYLSQHDLVKTLEKAYQVANQWCEENGYIVDNNGAKEIYWPSEKELINNVEQEALDTTYNAKNKNGEYLLEHNGRYKISKSPDGVDIKLDPSRFKQTGTSYDLDMGGWYDEPHADVVFYGKYYLNQDDMRKIRKDDSLELPENEQNNYFYYSWAVKERVWLFDLANDIADDLEDDGVDIKDYDGGVSVVSSQKVADNHNHKELDDYIYVTKQDIINYASWWTLNDFKTWSEFRDFCIQSFQ